MSLKIIVVGDRTDHGGKVIPGRHCTMWTARLLRDLATKWRVHNSTQTGNRMASTSSSRPTPLFRSAAPSCRGRLRHRMRVQTNRHAQSQRGLKCRYGCLRIAGTPTKPFG